MRVGRVRGAVVAISVFGSDAARGRGAARGCEGGRVREVAGGGGGAARCVVSGGNARVGLHVEGSQWSEKGGWGCGIANPSLWRVAGVAARCGVEDAMAMIKM